jgi:hypothetical protein
MTQCREQAHLLRAQLVRQAHRQRELKTAKHSTSLYRAMRKLRAGGLHRALGIAEDKPIPAERLEEARNSKNDHVAKMANFAHTMGKFKH